MDSLRGSVIDKNHVMASKTYANFVLIAVLTVVSVIADRVWVKNAKKYRSSRPRLIALMVVILILSAIAGYGLMVIALQWIYQINSAACGVFLEVDNYLERANFIEWEEAENYWADDTAIWNSTKAVSRVPRIGTFAVVARDE